MKKLSLENEKFPVSGGIDGRAARRAMGKPDMRFWDLFLRETLQNSWDARLRSSDRIRFSVAAVKMTPSQSNTLRDVVFANVPDSLAEFRDSLTFDTPHLVVVSDELTRGLGGATRADTAPVPNESRDYVDFVRNIGRASDKSLGGGTYGFGKSVLYDASSISTCLIYSQTLVGGLLEYRFVASSVSEQFALGGARFTGRHWWGSATEEEYVEPVTGDSARALAESLGLATMPTSATGTTLAVVSPLLNDEDSLREAVETIAEAATEWAWPHMVDLGSGPTIDFSFSAYGQRLSVRNPVTDPILQHFVRAFEQAIIANETDSTENQWPWTNQKIEVMRPSRREVGVLSHRRYVVPDSSAESHMLHHIALMRDPHFVVKYLPVAEDPSGQGIAGVFLASPSANDEFAKSEPVAHDDWVPVGGEGSRVSIVRVALNRLREIFKIQSQLTPDEKGNENSSGLTQVSRLLGSLLSGSIGSGSEIPRSKGAPRRGSASRPQTGIVLHGDPQLSVVDGSVMADFEFTFSTIQGSDASQWTIEGEPKVVLDGGSVEDPAARPIGEVPPQIVGWYSKGQLIGPGDSISAGALRDGIGTVRVKQPQGAAVTVILASKHAS